MNLTAQVLELIIGAFRLEAGKYPDGGEEYCTFYDAADALDDALELLEDLGQVSG